MFRLGISWGCRSHHWLVTPRLLVCIDRMRRAMRGKQRLGTGDEISGLWEGIAFRHRLSDGWIATQRCPEMPVYRGSWAAQSVVAKLATKRTRKATRITTTPPTVRRSHKSEVVRDSDSGFPVIILDLINSFTGHRDDCSDQHHNHVLLRPLGLCTPKIYPLLRNVQEREGTHVVFARTLHHRL